MVRSSDWLGPFIEDEVRAIIVWAEDGPNLQKIKLDSPDRFSDDGSNFRSLIDATQPSSDSQVQIVEILGTEDQVTLFLSDGFTRVKARLSAEALATLEAEIDEKVDSGTKGDIVSVKAAVMEVTTYGPSDGFVQLVIDRLEYMYHLRKPLGQGMPIENRVEIKNLLAKISDLRNRPLAETDLAGGHFSSPGGSRMKKAAHTRSEHNTPRSQRLDIASQHASPIMMSQSLNTQLGLATQVVIPRKAKVPTLNGDGFEVSDGVNLSRPVAPGLQTMAASVSKQPDQQHVALSDSTLNLLGVLGKRKAEAPMEQTPKRLLNIQVLDNHVEPSGQQQPHETSIASQAAPQHGPSSQLPPSNIPLVPAQVNPVGKSPNLNHSAAPQPSIAAKVLTQPSYRVQKSYRHRKIPQDQQKLLDRPSSWLPSLPGHQFPHPNIPIELLKRWNEQIRSGATDVVHDSSPVEGEPAVSDEQVDLAPTGFRAHDADRSQSNGVDDGLHPVDASSPSVSDDEELPASQWPPSPTQQRPALPPDSSMAANSRPSTAGHDAIMVSDRDAREAKPESPRSGMALSRPRSDSRTSSAIRKTLVHGGTVDAPFPGSQVSARDVIATVSTKSESPHQPASNTASGQPLGVHSQAPGSRTSASPAYNLPNTKHRYSRSLSSSSSSEAAAPPASSNVSFMRPSPRRIKHPPGSLNHTSPAMIRATQVDGSASDDDLMEVEVPRSLVEDPAVAHRQRRTEYFRQPQRQRWLKNNYETLMQSSSKSTQQPRFSILFNAYKKAHPDDTVRPSDFSDDVLAVCSPDEQFRRSQSCASTETSKPPLSKKGENVLSTPNPQLPQSSSRAFAADGNVSSPVAESIDASRTKPSAIGKLADTMRSNGVAGPMSTPATGRKLPWPSSGGLPISSTPIVVRKGSVQASKPLVSTGSFFKAFTTPKPPSTAPAKMRPVLVPQPTPVPSASRPPERTMGQDQQTVHPHQSRSPMKEQAVASRLRPDAFKAFAQAYRDLKPGGAFATHVESTATITHGQSGRRPGKQGLAVLSWQL